MLVVLVRLYPLNDAKLVHQYNNIESRSLHDEFIVNPVNLDKSQVGLKKPDAS